MKRLTTLSDGLRKQVLFVREASGVITADGVTVSAYRGDNYAEFERICRQWYRKNVKS